MRLQKAGFQTFMDEAELLAGDQFATRLQDEIRRSDGVVFLHTAHSAVSEWCHAELYCAIALKLPVMRLKVPDAPPLPDPLERLISGIHFLEWREAEPPPLDEQLTRARRHALQRNYKRFAMTSSILIVLAALVVLFFNKWDFWQTEQLRAGVIRSIESSRVMWTTRQVSEAVSKLQYDIPLLGRVRLLQDDPTVNNNAVRFNAWQVNQYISHELERGRRWDLSGIRWEHSALNQAVLSDVTIRNGTVEDLSAEHCRFAGVYLGPSPGLRTDEPGLSFVNARFTGCEFWNVWFDSTQFLGTEFHDSKFRGVKLGLEGLAAVRFTSSPAAGPVITGEMALFEDSVIYGLLNAPKKGVMDLSEPEQEVIFDGVEFVRVRFSGWFRPSWFRHSHFRDCTFPTSLSPAALASGKNEILSPDL